MQDVGKKLGAVLDGGLSAIVCIGELLSDRDAGRTFQVLTCQLQALLEANPSREASDWARVVLAYEPVWAIGTGKVATPEQAQEAHATIRSWVRSHLGADLAASLRIIYGGSVTAANCRQLLQGPDIDGFLVGGAALKPEFVEIVEACAEAQA